MGTKSTDNVLGPTLGCFDEPAPCQMSILLQHLVVVCQKYFTSRKAPRGRTDHFAGGVTYLQFSVKSAFPKRFWKCFSQFHAFTLIQPKMEHLPSVTLNIVL